MVKIINLFVLGEESVSIHFWSSSHSLFPFSYKEYESQIFSPIRVFVILHSYLTCLSEYL